MNVIPPTPPTPVIRVELYIKAAKSPHLAPLVRAMLRDEVIHAVAEWQWRQILNWGNKS